MTTRIVDHLRLVHLEMLSHRTLSLRLLAAYINEELMKKIFLFFCKWSTYFVPQVDLYWANAPQRYQRCLLTFVYHGVYLFLKWLRVFPIRFMNGEVFFTNGPFHVLTGALLTIKKDSAGFFLLYERLIGFERMWKIYTGRRKWLQWGSKEEISFFLPTKFQSKGSTVFSALLITTSILA